MHISLTVAGEQGDYESECECSRSGDEAADVSGCCTANTGGQMIIGGVIRSLSETLSRSLVALADEHFTGIITGQTCDGSCNLIAIVVICVCVGTVKQ